MSQTDAVLLDAHGKRTLHVGPRPVEGLPPRVLEDGLPRRRFVALGEACPCGAWVQVPNRAARRAGCAIEVPVEHETDCPAVDHALEAVVPGWRP